MTTWRADVTALAMCAQTTRVRTGPIMESLRVEGMEVHGENVQSCRIWACVMGRWRRR
jgi:hypothetical protein